MPPSRFMLTPPPRPRAPAPGCWRLERVQGRPRLGAGGSSVFKAARAWVLGANWYLTANLKLVTNFLHTRFDAAAGQAAPADEKAIFSRLQISF
ncbi:hypothetical protein STPYR_10047 [uncultured Stenotrophomonas sp.]|uniref:Phosphate-selective porin O and P n=1 Tax=uncultured Stenotrophomonas sp. TaxID=165438 RepID=A0A1Y5Q5S3_9GAMM|nr:hypothetical protein STPYR_10047 [uncultured Stenotrophomonas sp.]